MEIRGISISHASYKTKNCNQLEKELIDTINKTEADKMLVNNSDVLNLKKTRTRRNKTKGHVIRAQKQHG